MKTSRNEILGELLLSEKADNVLSIKLRDHARPFLTSVDKVLLDKILLQPTCIYGYPLHRRTITLVEIESVTRYNVSFSSPIFERIRQIKDNIRNMRDNIDRINERRFA